MKIKEITIRNFRSIINQTIKVSDMNIFVGTNDVGKSNILKALNLFFNNETEIGKQYDFETDFTLLYNPKSKTAKEIRISIVFEVPNTYKENGEIVWEKRWRLEGQLTDKERIFIKKTKEELSARSRTPSALRKIKFRYVPAVKSEIFFKELLGTLYDTMSLSLGDSIQEPMKRFSDTLQDATKSLSDDVSKNINIESLLTVPTDLRELFTTLDFDTHTKANINYSLNFRGDGIKTRHIPIILKYIAEQDMKSRNKGSMRIVTFWGYEEPENSLEMAKCFDMAEQFYLYSYDIQMFITTHSPSFYIYGQKERATLFHVEQKEYDRDTTVTSDITLDLIHKDIGVMQLVSPFINEVVKIKENSISDLRNILIEVESKLKATQKVIEDTGIVDVPTIFVEGKTDKIYLEKAIELFDRELKGKIDNKEIKIHVHEKFAGVVQVGRWIEAWCRTTNQSKMLAIIDCDKAAHRVNTSLCDDECVQKRLSARRDVKIIGLSPNQRITEIRQKGIFFEYSIENLLPLWIFKENTDLMEERKSMPFDLSSEVIDANSGYNQTIDRLIVDDEIKELFLRKHIPKHNKMQFCKRVLTHTDKFEEIFMDFHEIVNVIKAFMDNE